MPQPVVVVATVVPKEGRSAEVKQALVDSIPGTHAESGCLFYSLNEAPDGRLFTIEKWESAALLQAHLVGPGLQALLAAAGPLLASEPDIVSLAAVPAGEPTKGAL